MSDLESYSSKTNEDVDASVLTQIGDMVESVHALEETGHAFHGNQYTGGTGYGLHEERMRASAKNYAESIGFDPNKVNVVRYDRAFKVGDQDFKEGGHYDSATGTVTLNANSLMSKATTEEIVAHEVTHHEFNEVMKNVPVMGGPDTISEDLPQVQAFYHIYNENAEELAARDGVTNYSKAYWDVVKKIEDTDESWDEKYDAAFKSATNETLAEISSLKHAYNQEPARRIAPVWNKLHEKLRDAYTEVKHHEVMTRGGFKPIGEAGTK